MFEIGVVGEDLVDRSLGSELSEDCGHRDPTRVGRLADHPGRVDGEWSIFTQASAGALCPHSQDHRHPSPAHLA